MKWQDGMSYVQKLISAAQVVRCLRTNSPQVPEHETQVRPLVGLTSEQARAVWQLAVEKAGATSVTARLVKAAVRQLGFTPPAIAEKAAQAKSNRRKLLSDGLTNLIS